MLDFSIRKSFLDLGPSNLYLPSSNRRGRVGDSFRGAKLQLTDCHVALSQAIPDVAAQSDLFRIFFRGNATLAAGTSASTPTFAGFISLLNDARLKKGLPPLGFLNPLIYTIGSLRPTAFNDITAGNNPGCGTPGFNVSSTARYGITLTAVSKATQGWDPVTGFGTPNFQELKSAVTARFVSLRF